MKLSRAPTLFAALLVLVAIASVGCSFRLDSKIATAIAQSPTLWSQLATGPGVDVTIQAGDTVLFDVSEGNVRDLTVRGTFQVPDNADARLRVHRNLIIDGGRTIRGPTLQRFVIEWPSVFDPGFVGGGDHLTALPTDPGLWLFRGAQWQLNGDPKRAWMRLQTTLSPGATTIDLPDDPTGWRAGDELLITPTEPVTVAHHWLHHEIRTIASVAGRTVTLTQPLTYPHPTATINGQTYGAEVANLTRNVQLLGRPTGHPHLYAHGLTNPLTLEWLEIRLFGPRRPSPNVGQEGRYPLHLHRNADATRGSTVRGVVVRESGNWGFVTHASHGVTLEDTIAHDVIMPMRSSTEAAYGWDRSAGGFDVSNNSHDITYRRAGASFVRRVPGISSQAQRQAGFTTSEGLRNVMEDVWCSGVKAIPPDTGGVDMACLIWPEGSTARRQGVWAIRGAVLHNSNHGAFAWTNDDPHDPTLPHPVNDVVAYRNHRFGVDMGAYANAYRWIRLRSVENGTAAIRIHSLSLALGTAPVLSFEDGYYEGRGQLYAVMTANHTTTGRPVEWYRNHFTGYTRAAFGAVATSGAAELHTLLSNTFIGNPFWLASTIPSTSLLTVNDSLNGHLQLRRFDQVGEFRPEWNARVTTFAAPSR